MGPLGGTAAIPSFPQQPARPAFVAMADGAGTEAALAKQDAKAPSASSPVRSGTLSQMPPQAGRAGLPLTDGTGPLPAPSVQDRQERGLATLPVQASPPIAGNGGLSAAPPQAGNAQPPATAGHSAATAPVPAIASPAVAAEAVTSAEERNDDVAVPADGTAPNPTATAIFALAPPELVAPPAPANAPAMAIQAGAAPRSNASAIVSPGTGTGTAQADAGRPVAVPAPGTDRPAASERETSSAKAFDELASASAMAPDDFASAPTAPFGPVPAAHIAAPAPETAGFLPQAQAAPVPLGAVPMTIGLRSLAGSNRFEISLDPKDLGRIDVNLDIDKDSGTVTAHLTVDRPETLALLQRDVGNLQQALSQAGFDAGEAAINLSLRSDTGSNGGNGAERDGG
ncbi:flagellar hook-length control protein FliK, partial [Methylobacterium sp. W2]|uniref:flagellar hook-length control protein FliK n=1 Tax=Methylobacterium sp. W2 TaxID=2598107 RepID=UPI001D0C8797